MISLSHLSNLLVHLYPYFCYLALDIFPISRGRNRERVGERNRKKLIKPLQLSSLFFLYFPLSLSHSLYFSQSNCSNPNWTSFPDSPVPREWSTKLLMMYKSLLNLSSLVDLCQSYLLSHNLLFWTYWAIWNFLNISSSLMPPCLYHTLPYTWNVLFLLIPTHLLELSVIPCSLWSLLWPLLQQLVASSSIFSKHFVHLCTGTYSFHCQINSIVRRRRRRKRWWPEERVQGAQRSQVHEWGGHLGITCPYPHDTVNFLKAVVSITPALSTLCFCNGAVLKVFTRRFSSQY